MKDKKAQSLIVVLWILIILTMLALSLGQRVAMSLRFSKYQRDKLKAYCLAQAGLNRAISRIQQLGRYEPERDNQEGLDILAVEEEAKININSAPRLLIEVLLQESGISDFSGLANNICAWRGDTDPSIIIPDVYYANLGYSNKGKALTNIEELALIKGMDNIDSNLYDSIKGVFTVWGSDKVNIIKADTKILNILILYAQEHLASRGELDNSPGDLLDKIIGLRQGDSTFNDFTEIKTALAAEGLTPAQGKIIGELEQEQMVDLKSTSFYIVSSGKINQSNSKISCIFNISNPADEKILYWHES